MMEQRYVFPAGAINLKNHEQVYADLEYLRTEGKWNHGTPAWMKQIERFMGQGAAYSWTLLMAYQMLVAVMREVNKKEGE